LFPSAISYQREKGARFLFLPRYSPDLDPIERAFAKLKATCAALAPAPSMPCSTPSAKSADSSIPTSAGTTSEPQGMSQIKRAAL
jgi:hypothetical protein